MLALAYPGLGHLYLGLWQRALIWLAVVVGTSWLPLVFFTVPGVSPEFTLESFLASARALPLWLPLAILVALAASVVDAYRLAERGATRTRSRGPPDSATVRCPHCHKQLDDPTMDFCQWCAEPLDERP